jgi:hypothetical protein
MVERNFCPKVDILTARSKGWKVPRLCENYFPIFQVEYVGLNRINIVWLVVIELKIILKNHSAVGNIFGFISLKRVFTQPVPQPVIHDRGNQQDV